jgi:site-specific recombinase XerD
MPASDLEVTIAEYLIAARQIGRSPATLSKYAWHLKRLAAWLQERDTTHADQVTRVLLREWGASLHDRWAPASIKLAIAATRAFFAWTTDEGLIQENPALALKLPRIKRRVQRTLTAEEVLRILNACDDSPTGRRNAALVSLLADSGLRSAEVCRVKTADTRLTLGGLVVIGKGGNQGRAYFGQATRERLTAWLDVRTDQAPTLFVSTGGLTPGQPLTPGGLRAILRKMGKRAGVPGVSPHSFRRAFACIATEAGAPSRDLQEWGRWSDIAQVERYTAALRAGEHYAPYSPMDWIANHNPTR